MSVFDMTRTCAAVLIAAGALWPGPVAAQTPPLRPLTLEQALRLAEETSESVAASQASVRRATGEQDRARSSRLPQLTATVAYDRALATEFSGVFDNAGPTCAPFAANPAAPLDARVSEIERAIDCGAVGGSLFGGGAAADDGEAVDLPFGRANTWRFALAASQSIYTGGRQRALENIAAAGRDSADLALTTTRAQVLFDVTQAYFDAALSARLVAIAEATLSQADATLRQVQASFEAGAQPEFELLRARVSRDNQTPAVIRQRTTRDVALLRLKQLLELPADVELQLGDSLTDEVLSPPAPFAEPLAKAGAMRVATLPAAAATPIPERTAVREAGTVVRLREAALAAARAERRPSVSVTTNFSQVAYPSVFLPTGDFRTNWTVGAAMALPLLTGGRLRAEERIARADLDQSRAQLDQIEELAALDTRSAWAELAAAQAAWEATSGTIQQAQRAYEIADVRYRAGVSTQLELADARLLLQQSEANRAVAARDLQVARARVALLPDLPLSAGGSQLTPPQRAIPATPATPAAPATLSPLRNAAGQTTTPSGEPR